MCKGDCLLITPMDLQEAIAYYSGKVDPKPNDALMLAACRYLVDRETLLSAAQNEPDVHPPAIEPPETRYSYSGADMETVGEYGDSDFLLTVLGKDPAAVWAIMDDLMDTLRVSYKRVYDCVLREIREIE